MKYVFFGTPNEATIVLDTLVAHNLTPSLIVTAPDRPAGRGLKIEQSPVATWAGRQTTHTTVVKPESLKGNGDIANMIAGSKAELGIVFAYGAIIPQSIISLFPKGVLNIHPSLLPKYRGPAPVEGAILGGETETGVSVMLIDALMDHGPILAQEKVSIGTDETAPELLNRLVTRGASILTELILRHENDGISFFDSAKEQNHLLATFTQKITKADGQISEADIEAHPGEVYKKYRAYAAWPRLFYFSQEGERNVRTTITKMRMENGKCVVERIIPEGKKEKAVN